MKIFLELTGLEYRLIHEAVGLALQDAKEYRNEIDKKEKPIAYKERDYTVQKYAELYSKF